MVFVRCVICQIRLPTARKLMHHYMTGHSKYDIAKSLFTSNMMSMPKVKTKDIKKTRIFSLDYPKSETLYLNNNIHILCGQNEIVIGDEKSSVGMEFSFTEQHVSRSKKENKRKVTSSSSQSTEKNEENNNDIDESSNNTKRKPKKKTVVTKNESKAKKVVSKRVMSKSRHYRINITKLEECNVLNEKSGDFFICHCRGRSDWNSQNADLQVYTHDLDDLAKRRALTSVDLRNEMKAFCSKCGSGYKSDEELMEHMKIHEMHCRVCNEIFPTEQEFKAHTSTHIFKVFACHLCEYEYPFKQLLYKHFEQHRENEMTETVLDMEEDYKISRHNFPLLGHQSSMNSLLRFLSEGHDVCYYSYKYMKTICDICYLEMYVSEYEQHLQSIHYQYSFA